MHTPIYIKIIASILQSLVIFGYVFGSAMLLPMLVKTMPLWQVAVVAAVGGLIIGFTISLTMYVISH